jgi:hypothetical protein
MGKVNHNGKASKNNPSNNMSFAEMSVKKLSKSFISKFRVPDIPNHDNTFMCMFLYYSSFCSTFSHSHHH